MISTKEVVKKIALVGTSCVGKTTVFEGLKGVHEKDPWAFFVSEAARVFFQVNPGIRDRFSERTQRKIQALALKNEQTAHDAGGKTIVCDRSVLDAPAYVLATGDRLGSDRLLERVNNWIDTYTHIFLLDPTDIPMQNDDVRSEDAQLRFRFHQAFLQLFKEQGIPYQIIWGTPRERIQKVVYASRNPRL